MQLDDILLKDIDQLTSEEKTYLKAHKEELEDDEKESYKSVLEEKEEEKEEEKVEGFTFKSQEELDSYLDRHFENRLSKKEESKGEDEIPDFFDKDYKPSNWNQAFKDFLKNPKAVDFFAKNAKLKETVKEGIEQTEQEKEEQRQKINKEIDEEMAGLRKAHPEIPAGDSEEGKEWEKKLAGVYLEFPGLKTMNEAYKILQLKENQVKKEEEDKEDLARKIGGKGGNESGGKSKKYSEVAGGDMDKAFDRALGKLENS